MFIDNIDERLPRIALFSTRAIRAGEELTFDYKMQSECHMTQQNFVMFQIWHQSGFTVIILSFERRKKSLVTDTNGSRG